MRVAGGTSTGSKRPEALFGSAASVSFPAMIRSEGARLWDEEGREYLDLVMALGAVALGYGHPVVRRAAAEAIDRGTVGSLPPVEEEQLAALLAEVMPALERVRFLKTGAEAAAAAVRLARVATGRARVLGCGYHGWLDWSRSDPGVPEPIRGLFHSLRFNDAASARDAIRRDASDLACVVVEPVVDGPPTIEWLEVLREETARAGALLVFDEIKTGLRIALGGAVERWGVRPDLIVLGKALANGFPLAAVGGRAEVMALVERTWISSTLATESVSLAAAVATVTVARAERLPDHLARVGGALYRGLERLARRYADRVVGVAGVPEMCYLRFRDPDVGGRVAARCAERGLLFKRTAYNFVSLAHGESDLRWSLEVLEEALAGC